MIKYTLLSLITVFCLSCTTIPIQQTKPGPAPVLSPWEGEPLVRIETGLVKGYKDKPGSWVWRGIPYAAPPVGDLRWKAPRDVQPWTGIKRARWFGSPGMQYDTLSPRILGSEDCLYLNVWRPVTDEKRLPVMVWIHGGGNSTGSSNYISEYHGAHLAAKADVVVVSINYRLGPFGWFTHPAIRKQETDNPLDNSGNYGTLDIMKSLQWIQENIEAFGGDPGNITVAGESAGAINILSLILSPLAEGLFHKAIIRSGGFMISSTDEGDESSNRTITALLERDYRTSVPGGDTLGYLKRKSPEEILAAYKPAIFGMTGAPALFTDGRVIPEAGADVLLHGSEYNNVPVIIGSNKDETKIFLNWDPSFRRKDELYQAVTAYGSDTWRADGVDKLARAMTGAENSHPVYSYLFSWGTTDEEGNSPLPGRLGQRLGSFHSLEIPFFMGNLEDSTIVGFFFLTKHNRKGALALQEAIVDYVQSFLRTGDPNPSGSSLPRWEAWSNSEKGPKMLILNAGLEDINLQMSSQEYTKESVLRKLKESASAEVYRKVLDYMEAGSIRLE